jgi:PAS domain S-box-containing protein
VAYRPLTLYRIGLVVVAALILWRLPLHDVYTKLQAAPEGGGQSDQFMLAVLTLTACATGLLTLNFPGRSNITLLIVPVMQAWWQIDVPSALSAAAFGALFGNALRRPPLYQSVVGAARITIASAAGFAVAYPLLRLLTAPGAADPFEPTWFVQTALFVAVFSGVDRFLDRLDGSPANVVRTDPGTKLLVWPLALFFQVIEVSLGVERFAVIDAGVLALLFLVRASVNTRTLHESLQRLHTAVEAEREKLATVFGHSGEGIYTVDGDLRITSVNPALAALIGQDPAALEGRRCMDVCHFEDEEGRRLCPDRCPLRRAHATQRPAVQEVVYHEGDGPPKHLLLTYAAVDEPDGNLSLGIGIARDVTAQKITERLREEFVSLVTHELRSPLNVSIGYVDLLKRALRHDSDAPLAELEKVRSFVGRVESSQRHMLRLVNNLLEMARVERPDLKLEYDEIFVDEIILDCVENIRAVADEKQVAVQLALPDDLPPTWCSDLYLREIFGNLLSNAVKYTSAGGCITVAATVREKPVVPVVPVALPDDGVEHVTPTEWIEVAVSDTGYGMSEEDQARLFSKFFRSGNPAVRKERGTGLGLALAKRMVERLGGSIGVRSVLGEGSTFTVTLPVVDPPLASDLGDDLGDVGDGTWNTVALPPVVSPPAGGADRSN